ncbi:MAG: hypothetical protein HGB19_03575, partial [Chlorobiales bacterium]|nr:hypothetical protein [Chlorobiales bacterium]
MDTNLNKEIAQNFLTDARDFLERYSLLREVTNTDMNKRSKLLLDLIFAIECGLKALIFIESKKDAKSTYKKIKTHSFSKLIDMLDEETKLECIRLIGSDLNNYSDSIGIRYSFDSNMEFRNEQG